MEESEGGVDLELAGSLLENMAGVASQRHHQLVQHLKALKDGVIGIICQETFGQHKDQIPLYFGTVDFRLLEICTSLVVSRFLGFPLVEEIG